MVRMTKLITIGVFVVGTGLMVSTNPEAEELPVGFEIYELYREGKLTEARAALKKSVERATNYSEAIKPKNGSEMAGKIGLGVTAGMVRFSLKLEAKHAKSGTVSQELLDIADALNSVMRKLPSDLSPYFKNNPDKRARLKADQRFTNSARARMLAQVMVSLRSAGRMDEAKAIAEQNKDFLRRQGIPVAVLLGQVKVATPKASTKEEVSGTVLNVFQTIDKYYKALLNEDAAALDKVLCKGKGLRTGKDIVDGIEAERAAEKDFDKIGPVLFDAETRLVVEVQADGSIRARLKKAIKTLVVAGHTHSLRTSEVFEMRLVDKEYKILLKKRKQQYEAK